MAPRNPKIKPEKEIINETAQSEDSSDDKKKDDWIWLWHWLTQRISNITTFQVCECSCMSEIEKNEIVQS